MHSLCNHCFSRGGNVTYVFMLFSILGSITATCLMLNRSWWEHSRVSWSVWYWDAVNISSRLCGLLGGPLIYLDYFPQMAPSDPQVPWLVSGEFVDQKTLCSVFYCKTFVVTAELLGEKAIFPQWCLKAQSLDSFSLTYTTSLVHII